MSLMTYQLSGTWYVRSDAPDWRGGGTSNVAPYSVTFKGVSLLPASQFAALETYAQLNTRLGGSRPSYCQFNGSTNALSYCAAAFKLTIPAGTHLQAVSDIENISAASATDNVILRRYTVLVR